MTRTTLDEGIDLVKVFEGFHRIATREPVISAVPYVCPAGYWTLGYGSLRALDGEPVGEDTPAITEPEGEAMMRRDLSSAEASVHALLPIWAWELTDAAFGALVSFIYNVGSGNCQASTLRRKIKAGDLAGAANEFPRWVYGGGRRLPGLVRRREAERTLFLS